ncbi:60S ribosomal protein L31 [Perkinsus olseni]|uniref:60S ribosomal protein L31 n=2 Tax=Perkinsus TaxID=28000 RepID=A0A7J6R5R9_PEROL|nr:60S ribosomal protein L31 [Perkinsus olseni]KAF4671532.1 60S ribosomal protein L31 [Perkinsus olseni]KAF4686918.1 60S ribosomal protein L31 [Perkinsus olseni]KAF4716015.1 60S ribosomal protein L31 [Perkinsus olseni]KAF4716017.1 60S ribosomal protein L31 [Perkinsus olseni]
MAKGDSGNKIMQPLTVDHTIHVHKIVHKQTFKKRAPKVVRAIKAFAQKQMKTEDVRIDTKLNKFIWSKGIRNIPRRVRVRLSRRQAEEGEEMYTLVQYLPVQSFEGLQTEVVSA